MFQVNLDTLVNEVAYFGVKVTVGSYVITANIHGPIDTFVENTHLIKTTVRDCVRSYNTSNIPAICNQLAVDLRDKFCNGRNLLWVEVSLMSNNGLIYGTSAEMLEPEMVS